MTVTFFRRRNMLGITYIYIMYIVYLFIIIMPLRIDWIFFVNYLKLLTFIISNDFCLLPVGTHHINYITTYVLVFGFHIFTFIIILYWCTTHECYNRRFTYYIAHLQIFLGRLIGSCDGVLQVCT